MYCFVHNVSHAWLDWRRFCRNRENWLRQSQTACLACRISWTATNRNYVLENRLSSQMRRWSCPLAFSYSFDTVCRLWGAVCSFVPAANHILLTSFHLQIRDGIDSRSARTMSLSQMLCSTQQTHRSFTQSWVTHSSRNSGHLWEGKKFGSHCSGRDLQEGWSSWHKGGHGDLVMIIARAWPPWLWRMYFIEWHTRIPIQRWALIVFTHFTAAYSEIIYGHR